MAILWVNESLAENPCTSKEIINPVIPIILFNISPALYKYDLDVSLPIKGDILNITQFKVNLKS